MSYTILEVKNHVTPMLHSGTLNKVRNFEEACERAANAVLAKIKLAESIRIAGLTQTVHDNLFDYALPSDFYSLVDLYPQAERQWNDKATRIGSRSLDLKKMFSNRQISIEGKEGSKVLRISWKQRSPKTLNAMESITANGDWSVTFFAALLSQTAAIAAGLIASDSIIKYSGSGSIKFTSSTTGNGLSCSNMTALDLTDEESIADVIMPIYFESVTSLTSITLRWGNDVTANYWTGVAQTAQADGTAFRVGWNLIKVPWSTATETGTVDPAAIDSCEVKINSTAAISGIRADNIQFSIGYPFDIKYYSKFLYKNSSGTYITRPSSDDDSVLVDNDALNIFLWELVKACAFQLEGSDSVFDINMADKELPGLYQAYRGEHGDESVKKVSSYGGKPRFQR